MTSFWATRSSPGDPAPGEDYWQLIGRKGLVVSNDARDGLAPHVRGPRVLVKFDEDIGKRGLHCHNPVANALYLFLDDVEKLA